MNKTVRHETQFVEYYAVYYSDMYGEYDIEPDACFASYALAEDYVKEYGKENYIINRCGITFFDNGDVDAFEETIYEN